MSDLLIAIALAITIFVLFILTIAISHRISCALFVRKLLAEGRDIRWVEALVQVQANQGIFVHDHSRSPSLLWFLEQRFLEDINYGEGRHLSKNESDPEIVYYTYSSELDERMNEQGLIVTNRPRGPISKLEKKHELGEKMQSVYGDISFTD